MSIYNTPVRIGTMELKNRFVMPPMASAKCSEDGMVTQQLCDYYDQKTRSGCLGLVITEHSYVCMDGKAHKGQLSIAGDSTIAGFAKLVQTIHANGTKVMAQISHAGSAAAEAVTGCTVLGPSVVLLPNPKPDAALPQEMTQAEIDRVIEAFAAAAVRAKDAGFDGVEIHSAHRYLLNQFYSPLTNHRTDRYCGSTLEGRLQLHLEVIRAVREAVGAEYPIAVRLGACDYMDGGSTLEDAVAAAKILEAAGVDLLDISGGMCGYRHPSDNGQGYFAPVTQAIKQAVHVPVLLTGGITEPAAAEKLLEEEKADLIGIGRALLKDSDWAKHAYDQLSAAEK